MTATAAERMITAIGNPVNVDTSKDSRLGHIFLNRTIKVYPSMAGFFGMEDTIQRVVSYFQHRHQRFEENLLLRLIFHASRMGIGEAYECD